MSITLDLPKSVEKQYTKEQLKAILTAYILLLQKQQEFLKPKKKIIVSEFEAEGIPDEIMNSWLKNKEFNKNYTKFKSLIANLKNGNTNN